MAIRRIGNTVMRVTTYSGTSIGMKHGTWRMERQDPTLATLDRIASKRSRRTPVIVRRGGEMVRAIYA